MGNDDLTIKVLEKIQAELSGLRGDVAGTNRRLEELHTEMRAGFAAVVHVMGSTHGELDRRVTRIEDHLGLSRRP